MGFQYNCFVLYYVKCQSDYCSITTIKNLIWLFCAWKLLHLTLLIFYPSLLEFGMLRLSILWERWPSRYFYLAFSLLDCWGSFFQLMDQRMGARQQSSQTSSFALIETLPYNKQLRKNAQILITCYNHYLESLMITYYLVFQQNKTWWFRHN